MFISLKTEVDYYLPGIGKTTMLYDANSEHDMACWYTNSRLYPQLHARTLDEVELDPDKDKEEIERFAAVKAKARALSNDLMRVRES